MGSGDEDLDAGWDEESPASPAKKPDPASSGAGGSGDRSTAAPPETTRFNPDRATLPPPMPEQEYIEKILATDESVLPPKRQRLSTLIDQDPLQYDAPDAHQRPTRPPASAAASSSSDDGFLDLRLDEELARRSSDAPQPVIPPPPPAPSRVSPAATRAPATVAPSSVDPLDELPIDAVLDSLSPESLRPAGPTSARSKAPPPPAPTKPKPVYDDTPSIEVVELATRPVAPRGAAQRPPPPPPRKTPLGTPTLIPQSGAKTPLGMPSVGPSARPTPLGTPSAAPASAVGAKAVSAEGPAPKPPPPMSKTPVRVASVKAAEAEKEKKARGSARPPKATPASGTKTATPSAGTKAAPAQPKRQSKPPKRTSEAPVERPTRAIRTPAQVVAVGQESASEKALVKVAERFEAGDYGRALMLAEQVLALDEGAAELRHYAELCREKLRQTYLERIGTGRTILRVSISDEKLRERSLDPRLAFLLSLLDGASSVDDVVDMSTMPPLEAVRALHELLVEGVVEVVERLRKAP